MKIRFTLSGNHGDRSYSEVEDYAEYLEELELTEKDMQFGKWSIEEIEKTEPQIFPAFGWYEAYCQRDIADLDLMNDPNATLKVEKEGE